MKTKKALTFIGISIIAIISLMIYSCQKEKTLKENSNSTLSTSDRDLQLEKKILNFRNQINYLREHPDLKSGGDPWEVEDAIYYIEALANYTYGLASYSREGYTIDSSFITVPLTNGLIPAANIAGIYDKVIDSLGAHNDQITAQDKQLIVVDISLDGIIAAGAIFQISSGFGTSNGIGTGNDYPWYWGWELGRCDTTGLGEGKDAADKIMELANYSIGVQSGYSYFDNESYVTVWCFEVPTETNPYGDYMLFYDFQIGTLNHHCCSTGEINYYKNALSTVGEMYKPQGKELIAVFCWDETSFDTCGPNEDDCWTMVHVCQLQYGIWHLNSNPPSEL